MLEPTNIVILIYSTADWDAPYWTNKQHMAMDFVRRGFKVVYIESPGLRKPSINTKDLFRIWRRVKTLFQGPRRVADNLIVLSGFSLPFLRGIRLVRWLNEFVLKIQIGKVLKCFKEGKLVIWSYHPYAVTALDREVFKIVYHSVDDLSQVPGVDAESLNLAERKFLRAVDIVFVTAKNLEQKLSEFHDNVHFLGNVVDFEHFSQAHINPMDPAELSEIPHPRIGYAGVLTDLKVDFQLILNVARLRPEWHWVLIGDEREGQKSEVVMQLRRLQNVHFLGYRPYSELPKFFAGLDVGVLPTLLNSYTGSMFPMKYFEYIASGLRVVSTALEFAKDQSAIEIGADRTQFMECIQAALSRGRLTLQQSKELVGENTWDARTETMIKLIFETQR